MSGKVKMNITIDGTIDEQFRSVCGKKFGNYKGNLQTGVQLAFKEFVEKYGQEENQ